MKTNGILNEERLAWKTLRAFATIMTMGSAAAIFIWTNKYSESLWQWPLAFSASVLALIYVLKRPDMRQRQVAVFYFMISFVHLFGAFISSQYIMKQSHNAVPFEVHKFIALVVAFLAPQPRFVGYVIIAFCCLIPPVQILLSPDASFPGIYFIEPWLTMAYAIAGLVILRHRLETRHLEISLAAFRAREKSWSDFADVVVALRDLTNSPVQSLELLVDLLKNEKISCREASELLDKEVYKLREISEIFAQYQRTLIWKHGSESLDSLAVLRQKLSSHSTNQVPE